MKVTVLITLVLSILSFCFCSTSHSQSMSELNVKVFEEKVEIGKTSGIKNPFAHERGSPQDMSVEDLYLTGIVVGGGGNFALVNGYTFREGDRIAGLVVKSISSDKVVLQKLDRIHTLYLGGGQ